MSPVFCLQSRREGDGAGLGKGNLAGKANASWSWGPGPLKSLGGGDSRREGGCAHSPASASLARTPPGQQAGVLQEARVPIISNEVCNGPDFYANQIKPKMFCAGYPEGGIDACQVRDWVGRPRAPATPGMGTQGCGWLGSLSQGQSSVTTAPSYPRGPPG